MKKLSILIMLVLLILQGAMAQNQKGDQTLGLSLGFYTGNGSNSFQTGSPAGFQLYHSSSTALTANPGYSYFIANRLDIGASFGFGAGTDTYSYLSNNNSSTQRYKNYFGSVYLRKYYLYNNRIGIRTGPFIAYQFNSSSLANFPDNFQLNPTSKGIHAGIDADFVYYPSAKVGLAVNLGSLFYGNVSSNSQQQNSSQHAVILQFLNNNLFLSAFYVFGK
jgi:hypothetical protein